MLVRRGQITVYVEPAILNQKEEVKRLNEGKVGRPYQYGNFLIFASFAVKCLLRLGYREVEGIILDISEKLGLEKVPNFRTMWRRIKTMRDEIDFNVRPLKKGEKIEIAIDASGLKRVNDGDYRALKYQKRRDWIKLHLSVNVDTMDVVTEVTTTDHVGDNKRFRQLVNPVVEFLRKLYGDGAYDDRRNFEYAKKHGVTACIPVDINAVRRQGGERRKAVIEQFDIPKLHNRFFIDSIERRRRKQKLWKKKVHFGDRWVVESAYSKFKRMFGEYVFSKKWGMIQKEIRTKLYLYNLSTLPK
jgi:hypothetical protein